jgi:hypothetical protein
MKTGRAILAGALIWLLVFVLFGVLDFIPATRDSQLWQGVIAGVLVIPFALLGAWFYYKNGARGNGGLVALVMVTTALLLDVLITVPLVELPYHGRDHQYFFTNPTLWIIVMEDLLVIYFYSRMKTSRR